jgi:hypothetical protein
MTSGDAKMTQTGMIPLVTELISVPTLEPFSSPTIQQQSQRSVLVTEIQETFLIGLNLPREKFLQ